MNAQSIGRRIQAGFDFLKDMMTPVENRWITLSVTVFIFLVLRAAGAQGVAEIIALVYIMYWVTLRGPRQERDE